MMRLCVLAVAVLSVVVSGKEEVLVFGNNQNGHLGVAEEIIAKPTQVSALSGKCIKHSTVTSKNAIFVTCDGKVYVSGLGIAPNGAMSMNPGASAKDPIIVEQLTGYKVAMAATGDNHFVVLTNDNKVFTWGSNHDGQLGHGNDVPFVSSPIEIESLARRNVRMIAAGGNRTAALTDDGKLYIWGAGNKGEMGDSTVRSHRKPTLVESFQANNERVCQVAIGASHVAAVTTAGDLYTWGDGTAGQLGLGDFGIQSKKPAPVSRLRRNVCFVTAGEDYTAVVSQDERVFLWGSNGYPKPFEKTFFQSKKPRQISSGLAHMDVLLNDGSVYTWGSRRLGQAGRDFSGQFSLDPGILEHVSNVTQIATGDQQSILLQNSGFPAVSLCSCLGMWFGHWRTTEKYLATCTDDQQKCADDSCCAGGSTCCPIDDRKIKSVAYYKAIDEKAPATLSTGFRCMPAKNAVCCNPLSGVSCPADFLCNLETSPKRCEPASLFKPTPVKNVATNEPARIVDESSYGKVKELTDEDIAMKSEEPIRSSVFSDFPGAVVGVGVCGVRKETCPDDSCCALSQTCCPLDDGSFGCCPHDNGKCCSFGCCAEGYDCDDEHATCVPNKSAAGAGTSLVTKPQERIENHCGSGKRSCPDRSCCAENTECCVLSDGFFGCCPYHDGVCCADGSGCCPDGSTCDVTNSECVRKDGPSGTEVRVSMKATPRNTPHRSVANEITCPNGLACQYPGTCCDNGNNVFTCCDFINGTCCSGGLGCCPSGFECDLDGSACRAATPSGNDVPMKFTRDPKPKQHVDKTEGAQPLCQGETLCHDNSCCPLGSTCCEGANGQTTCCDYMNAVCCEGGGCCSADHLCDAEHKVCRDASGSKSYPLLPETKSTIPPVDKEVDAIAAPGKCYPDEIKCDSDFCCPRGGTCCDKGFGQHGCCPHSHGVCCENGGCCPMGSVCDAANKGCNYPDQPSKQSAPMLAQDTPRPPEAEWDMEECWTDEQTCSIDAGCCLKTETCCVVTVEGRKQSACCPFENGICCEFGGCCPSDGICDEEKGMCVSAASGAPIDSSPVRGSAIHPLAGLSEIDCPDGSVCGPFDTCCTLGFDEGWGEEIFACCPFENAVCCKEFEGCCPNGFECDADTQGCISGTRELPVGNNQPTDPPPTFVCLWPQVQCPNYKCCEKDYQCVEQAGGNYKCLPRGYVACGNGTYGCPQSLYCDHREEGEFCSEEVDTDPQVKQDIITKYWGENPASTCAALADNALVQTKQEFVFHPKVLAPELTEPALAPPKVIVHPPPQFWYPKRLAVKSRAAKSVNTQLPTLLVAKICQHLIVSLNSTVPPQFCYTANANGHYAMKERDRVQALVTEYSRRLCNDQKCIAGTGRTWTAIPEELDPCPCRPLPTPLPEVVPLDNNAGTNPDAAIIAEEIANAEQNAVEAQKENSSDDAPLFIDPIVEVADEKPVSAIGMGSASAGTVPVYAEKPVEEDSPVVKYTLVMPTRDEMQLSPPVEVQGGGNGDEMARSKQAETFMGKEACNNNTEDDAETAVDLDGEVAVQLDVASDRMMQDTTLAQMEANASPAGNVIMPEDQ